MHADLDSQGDKRTEIVGERDPKTEDKTGSDQLQRILPD